MNKYYVTAFFFVLIVLALLAYLTWPKEIPTVPNYTIETPEDNAYTNPIPEQLPCPRGDCKG